MKPTLDGKCNCGELRFRLLEQPGQLAPDIHIFTSSKQPWVILPESVPAVSEYYQRSKYWPAASLERMHKLKESMQ